MTQSELCAVVRRQTGTKKQDVDKIVKALCEAIAYDVGRGNRAKLSNFGTFMTEIKHDVDEEGHVHKVIVPVFKPGKMILDAVNKQ